VRGSCCTESNPLPDYKWILPEPPGFTSMPLMDKKASLVAVSSPNSILGYSLSSGKIPHITCLAIINYPPKFKIII
jgi:hypothetical protein